MRRQCWRRRRDLNPRDPFGPNGFQDRRFQPLTHSSVSKYNLQLPLAGFLVTLSVSIAAFWCRMSPNCHQNFEFRDGRPFGIETCRRRLLVECRESPLRQIKVNRTIWIKFVEKV